MTPAKHLANLQSLIEAMASADTLTQTEIDAKFRFELSMKVGDVWTYTEAQKLFEFVSFCAPFVEVVRKSDGKKGSLEFVHLPRFYFNFVLDVK